MRSLTAPTGQRTWCSRGRACRVILVPRPGSGRVDPKEDTTVTVARTTVDLDAYLDLVIVYRGMRVRATRGLRTLLGSGPQIGRCWREEPDGLLLHEDFMWSLVPPHSGMRQYWRDLDSLERWTRSEPHRRWWKTFAQRCKDSLLARGMLRPQRHRRDVRRHDPSHRPRALRSRDPRTWSDVLSAPAGQPHRSRHRVGSSPSHSSPRRRETRFSPLNQPSSTPTARFR
jgi:hypothetical protein